MCPCPHQARQVLAAPLLCLAKEQKQGSQPGHAEAGALVSSLVLSPPRPHPPRELREGWGPV